MIQHPRHSFWCTLAWRPLLSISELCSGIFISAIALTKNCVANTVSGMTYNLDNGDGLALALVIEDRFVGARLSRPGPSYRSRFENAYTPLFDHVTVTPQ